ncbi:MAG: glycosyltransferase family 4 protein [Cyanobacteria bacterium RM1_2_2]|nr:glycosyltransferase family 4 protein [Cyanobacteria bacterium RM1_2_2]
MNLSSFAAEKPITTSKTAAPHLFLFLEIFSREGGIQSYVQDIFRGYAALEHSTHADVFLLRDGKNCTNPFANASSLRFHYFKAKSPQLGRLHFATALLRYLIQHRPQQVFCGHINLAPMVQLFCQPLGIPYTVLTYGKEVWQPLPPTVCRSLQQADQIWTISRYSRDEACAANQLDPAKVQFLSCAVDGNYFTPGEKSPDLLEKYRLSGSKVLLTVARLWSGDIYKGVDVTIRALPTIAQQFPDVKYLVIGRGDDQPRLAKLAEGLGVADRVVFAGFVPTEDLMAHYRLADAYIMPSQEGFGIVYLEAMACGIPVLSGDADGSADPLQDGELGWRVPHRDSNAVAEACIEMLTQIAKRECGEDYDQRCDGNWLREQAIARFGKPAFAHQLQALLSLRG